MLPVVWNSPFTEDAANDPVYDLKPKNLPQQSTVKATSLVTTTSIEAMDTTTDYPVMDTIMENTKHVTQKAPECAVCQGKHSTTKYCMLRRMGPSEQLNKVRSLHVFCCLRPGHGSRRCEDKDVCGVLGCQRFYATLLHDVSWPSSSKDISGTGQTHTRIVQAGTSLDSHTPPPSSPLGQARGPALQQLPAGGPDAEGPGAMFSGHTTSFDHCPRYRKVALPIVTVSVKGSWWILCRLLCLAG